jgi:hypothetical protein
MEDPDVHQNVGPFVDLPPTTGQENQFALAQCLTISHSSSSGADTRIRSRASDNMVADTTAMSSFPLREL